MNEMQSLAEEVGVQQRTLRRAAIRGTIRATRLSPQKLHVPLSERQYIRRRWSTISALQSALRTEPNVRFALLFGSVASGTDIPESDVDLLVQLRDSDLIRVVDLSSKLAWHVERRVDLTRMGDAAADPAFFADVLESGRVLVDREDEWPQLSAQIPELRRSGKLQTNIRYREALAGIDRFLEQQRAKHPSDQSQP